MMNIYMAKKPITALVDSDFLIGLFYEEDSHHLQCKRIIDRYDGEFIIAWDVIDEVTTKLSYFAKKQNALNFLKMMLKLKTQIVYPDEVLLEKALKVFSNQTSKKVSFTDCVNMVIAKMKNLRYVVSFDKIYEKNGFLLLQNKLNVS